MRSLVIAAVAACLTACSMVVGGSPTPVVVELGALDLGAYSGEPLHVPAESTADFGRVIESARIADIVVDPYEVDPGLRFWAGAQLRPDPDSFVGGPLGSVRSVLSDSRMVAGYEVSGSDVEYPANDAPGVGHAQLLTIVVIEFPDDVAAASAAAAIAAAMPGDDVPTYPSAVARRAADASTVTAVLPSGPSLVVVVVEIPGADEAALAERTVLTFESQVSRLATFTPAGEIGLAGLPLDTESMLARTLPRWQGTWPYPHFYPDSAGDDPTGGTATGIVLTRRAALHRFDDKAAVSELFDAAGVEYLASVYEGALVARALDDVGARLLVAKQLGWSGPVGEPIRGPEGVPDASCYAAVAGMLQCDLSVGRYAAQVFSRNEIDLRQRAAAQYALLVNS